MSATKVSRKIIPNGLELYLDRKDYQILYPGSVWKEFPDIYRQNFADAMAFALTMHLCLNGHAKIVYDFPVPQIEPYIFEGMLYSLGETTLLEGKETRTSDLIRLFYNRNLNIEFSGRPRLTRFQNLNRNSRNRAIIPFSFGKDSLLTFALCQELGIDPYPIFFREPKSPFENRHKRRLADRFFEEFDVDVNFFPLSPGRLRQTSGKWWGWDIVLTQYTMLLIPYIFALRARYLFWAHEQSCNDLLSDSEGYTVNPVFEQSSRWLLTSNNLTRNFGTNVALSSLIEPLHEIAIMKILHSRYPEVAKYQLSCFAEEDSAASKRWCGECSKCARIAIFMLALGINPKTVGLTESMLGQKKRELFGLFEGEGKDSGVYDKSGLGRDEQLLAFYMTFRRGIKGELMKEFAKKYLLEASSRERELREKFFGVHSATSLPYDLSTPLLKIFRQELSGLSA
ncbi:hypothetical protein HY440_00355 [Candidatus Microgenomates bacterium]|nr:hypothetical protein [Candidatus Microgenomates bacterium]